MMKIGLNELKLRFRTRLTEHFYEKYLRLVHEVSAVFLRILKVIDSKSIILCYSRRGYTYYQMSNLDNRISNPDQLLTQDTEKFCDSIAELYSNLSKVSYASY